MYRRGHRGIVLLALAPVLFILFAVDRPILALLAWGVLLIEPLPDRDQRINWLEHRGTSHSLFTAGIVGVCCGGLGWVVGRYVTEPLTIWLLSGGVIGPNAITWTETHLGLLDATMLALVGICIGAGGIVLHLLGDVITIAGIQPFLPFSKRNISFSLLHADNTLANRGLFTLGVLAIVAVGFVMTPLGEFLMTILGRG